MWFPEVWDLNNNNYANRIKKNKVMEHNSRKTYPTEGKPKQEAEKQQM